MREVQPKRIPITRVIDGQTFTGWKELPGPRSHGRPDPIERHTHNMSHKRPALRPYDPSPDYQAAVE